MREILFRGKTEDGSRWVYGMPCATEQSGIYAIQTLQGGIFDIIPETIGQYTGLTDKNGKKIFEGDIVKISDINENFVCVWEKDNFEYEFKNKTMSFSVCGVHQDDIEIIGNIHDNKLEDFENGC